MNKTKAGESTSTTQKEKSTEDLKKEVEAEDKLDTLEELYKLKDSTLTVFLKENPDIINSELNRILWWISNADGWFLYISSIKNDEGKNFVRFTVAPPDGFILNVVEENDSKKIVLEEK